MKTNRELYEGPLLNRWSEIRPLSQAEAYVLDEWLRPKVATVEGGCGGGRISLELSRRGIGPLTAFDYVPQLVQKAVAHSSGHEIHFDVADATHLPYSDSQFGQAVYLAQVLCFIESDGSRTAAVSEMARVIEPGGLVAMSFLSIAARRRTITGRLAIGYLRILRRLLRALGNPRPDLQKLPWLLRGNRLNWWYFLDRPPYVQWFTCQDVRSLLIRCQLEPVLLRTEATIGEGAGEEPPGREVGALYVIARRAG